MTRRRLYLLLQPESPDNGGRLFCAVHHLMVAAGIAIMLSATVTAMADAHGPLLEIGFYVVAAFFLVEYVLRLIAAPEAPGGEHRKPLDARLGWATSLGGVFDLVCTLPGLVALLHVPEAGPPRLFRAFQHLPHSPGLPLSRPRITPAPPH